MCPALEQAPSPYFGLPASAASINSTMTLEPVVQMNPLSGGVRSRRNSSQQGSSKMLLPLAEEGRQDSEPEVDSPGEWSETCLLGTSKMGVTQTHPTTPRADNYQQLDIKDEGRTAERLVSIASLSSGMDGEARLWGPHDSSAFSPFPFEPPPPLQ